jgi:uncharacterized protein YdaU (DUF1376 family)
VSSFPYFRLYPRDFLSDSKVMPMTHAEFGAYVKLLFIAWDEEPRGSLPKPLVSRLLASLSETEIQAVLSPFEERDGRYFQKRMVHEAEKLASQKQAFSEGGKRGMQARYKKDISTLQAGYNKSEVISQNKEKEQKKARKLAGSVDSLSLPLFLDKPEFRKALADWQEHKKAIRSPLTQHALELTVRDCENWGVEKSIEHINHSIKCGWKAVWEPSHKPVTSQPPQRQGIKL